jgi:predicted HTH transcriptional regulator
LVDKLADGLVEGLVERLVDGLVENQKKIVRLIHRDPHISKKKMAEVIGISVTAVDKNIETLKKNGLIKRFGNAKHGHWKIVNDQLKDKPEDKNDGLADGLVDGLVERLVDGLVENQKKILKLIQNDPHISKKKMAETVGISSTAVDKNMETLKKRGLIKRFGNARYGHWKIINDQLKDKPEDKNNGLVDGLVERLVDGLVENQEKIVRLIHRDSHISKKKMAEIIGISTTAVGKNIDTLKKKGILKRVGPDKGGHWEILEPPGIMG